MPQRETILTSIDRKLPNLKLQALGTRKMMTRSDLEIKSRRRLVKSIDVFRSYIYAVYAKRPCLEVLQRGTVLQPKSKKP